MNASLIHNKTYLATINFKMLPIIGDVILFNNEEYKVVKREFNTYIHSTVLSKNPSYSSDDINLYVEQITHNYKDGKKTNNGINY